MDSTPVLAFFFAVSVFGVSMGTWVVVMQWLEGKEAWAAFPFIALWSWGAWSSFKTWKIKKEAESSERKRLSAVVAEIVLVGTPLKDAVQSARDRLSAEGLTRYRQLSSRAMSAEFDMGPRMIRIVSVDGNVSGFDVV